MAEALRFYDELSRCNASTVTAEHILGFLTLARPSLHPDCKLTEIIMELVFSEILLSASLLFASLSTPEELFAEPLATSKQAIRNVLEASSQGQLKPSLATCFSIALPWTEASRVLGNGVKRVQQLIAILAKAQKEPFHTTHLHWAENSHARCALHFFHTGSLPVPPTRPYFEKPFGYQERFSLIRNHDPSIVGEVWRELAGALHRIGESMTLDWFPTQGTLLSLLRYGELPGLLADGKVDLVDKDLDILVVLPSAHAWFDFSIELTRQLTALAWPGCILVTQLPRFLDSAKAMHPKRRGRQRLRCVRILYSADKKKPRGNVVVDIVWMIRVQQVHTDALRPVCRPANVDESAPCQVQLVQPTARSAAGKEEVFDLSRDVSCDDSTCWARDLMPSRLWQEKGRCGAFGAWAPCPRHASEHLLAYLGQEHDIASLALPDMGCSERWPQRRLMVPHNVRLYCEGLSVRDVAVLRQRRLWLKSRGFLTMNFTGMNWKRCIRTKLLKHCRGFQSTFAAPERSQTDLL